MSDCTFNAAQPFFRNYAPTIPRLFVGVALRHRLRMLAERQERYRRIVDPQEIAAWQCRSFNAVWHMAKSRYRFYAEWQRRHGLPAHIDDVAELSRFPLLRKSDIEANLDLILEDARPCAITASGGTSGPSVTFPRGAEDHLFLHTNMYLARSWAGVVPGDRIVLIWGHEHLYGFGLKGRINRTKRGFMDRLIGTERLSVYTLGDATVAAYVDRIRRRPGAVVVGYVSAIRKLLDFIEQSGRDGRAVKIRAVIFCSETVFASDIDRVRRLLGAVPLIEYGMGETGVMAYSTPESSVLTFLWDAIHCSTTNDGELVVTSLQPLRFPLINYGTGDRVQLAERSGSLPFTCARIAGRTRALLGLPLRGGRAIEVHSDLLEECLDLVPEVRAYFIHQQGELIDVAVRTSAEGELATTRRRFLDIVARHCPGIDESKMTFSILRREPYTAAGKRQFVLRESAAESPRALQLH